MGQSGMALGDGPEASQTQGIHGQSAERGQDVNAIALSVAVRDFLELGSRHAARRGRSPLHASDRCSGVFVPADRRDDPAAAWRLPFDSTGTEVTGLRNHRDHVSGRSSARGSKDWMTFRQP